MACPGPADPPSSLALWRCATTPWSQHRDPKEAGSLSLSDTSLSTVSAMGLPCTAIYKPPHT